MRPKEYLFRLKEFHFEKDYRSVIVFLLLTVFFVYTALSSSKIQAFVVLVPYILFSFSFLIKVIYEEIIWDDGVYLRKYTPKLLFWKTVNPIPATEIVGFADFSKESLVEENKFRTLYDIYVLLKNDEPIPILKNISSEYAYNIIRTLSNEFRDGKLNKDNTYIEAFYNNIIQQDYPNIEDINELSYLLKNLSDEIIQILRQNSDSLYDVKAMNLLYYLKINKSITRSALSKFNSDDCDQLNQIYNIIANSFYGWQEFILTEICRLFDDAKQSSKTDMLRALEAFSDSNHYWNEMEFSENVRVQLESYTSSPSQKISNEANRLLSVMT